MVAIRWQVERSSPVRRSPPVDPEGPMQWADFHVEREMLDRRPP